MPGDLSILGKLETLGLWPCKGSSGTDFFVCSKLQAVQIAGAYNGIIPV